MFSIALPEDFVTVPSPSALVALLLAAVLLLFSAFASGSEIAFFSLSRTDIEELENSKSPVDKRLLRLLSDPDRLLATILIVNDFVNVGVVMLLNYFFLDILNFGGAVWLEFLLMTVVLTIGEMNVSG